MYLTEVKLKGIRQQVRHLIRHFKDFYCSLELTNHYQNFNNQPSCQQITKLTDFVLYIKHYCHFILLLTM